MEQRVDFIVLYQGRAGSSYLMRALDRHPDITAHGEILNWLGRLIVPNEELSVPRRLLERVVRFVKGEPALRQLRAFEKTYDAPDRATRVLGFKTKLRVIADPEGLQALLERRQVRTVVMERRNLVKKAVAHVFSQRLYQRTKDAYGEHAWNLFDERDRLGAQHIPPEELDRWLRRVVDTHEKLRAYARGLAVPKLHLEYDDLLLDETAWFGSIFDFLGVEHRDLESPVLRNEPPDLREALTNFDELRSGYRGTRFEPMFDEIL